MSASHAELKQAAAAGKREGRAGGNGALHAELLFGEPADSEADIPRRRYVVPRYLPRGVVTLLIGPSSAGKSQMSLSWSVALALGHEYGGFKPDHPARVALFNVEDDIDEQQRRVAAALRMFGARKADLHGRLTLLNPARSGLLLSIDPEKRRMGHTPLMSELLATLDVFKPELLILDPLIELHDAQENDNTALRHVVSEFRVIAQQRGLAILLLHHTPKGTPRPGDQDAGRGASSIGGVGRKSFTLYEMTEAEAAAWKIAQPQLYFRLDGAKANHEAKNGTEWFERVTVTLDNGDVTATARPWQPPTEMITDLLIDQLMETVAIGEHGQPWSIRLGHYDRSISKALTLAGIGSRSKQDAVVAGLLAKGCIEAAWKRKNRARALGLRHPDGRPKVEWLD